MIINLSFDTSTNSAPAGFFTALNAVVQFLEANFTDQITVNISVGWGETGGETLPSGALGQSEFSTVSTTFAQMKSLLTLDEKTATDVAAMSNYPLTDPTGGAPYEINRADAKALGLINATSGNDGAIGFTSSSAFDFDESNGISPGTYDFYGVAMHEITEVMGRVFGNGTFEPLDMFHYSGTGNLDLSGTQAGYFSINNGVTDLADFNTDPTGDFSDWANNVDSDAFRAFAPSGRTLNISEADLEAMDVIGFDRALASPPPPPAFAKPHDFNGDGKSDILWQNTNGQADAWLLNGTSVTSAGDIGSNPGTAWAIKATGDFNGDGKSDILWQNANGQADVWLLNGTSVTSAGDVGSNPGTAWAIKATGDFNGDGKSDILWQNANGQADIWLLNGTSVTTAADAGANPGTAWAIKATGDFNGDGKSDILWQNSNGQADIWLMNGTSVVSASDVGANPGTAWSIKATGDFNGDGKSDILWQNSNGQADIWLMNGTTILSASDVGANPGTAWTIKGTGDFNGDGKSDILWQNSSGQADVWLMNGTTILSAADVGSNPGTAWNIVVGSSG